MSTNRTSSAGYAGYAKDAIIILEALILAWRAVSTEWAEWNERSGKTRKAEEKKAKNNNLRDRIADLEKQMSDLQEQVRFLTEENARKDKATNGAWIMPYRPVAHAQN